MKVTVIGKKKTEYTDNETKQLKQSAAIYGICKLPPSNEYTEYDGECACDIKVPFEYVDSIEVGDKLLMDFDKNGKLLEMEKL